MKADFRLLQHQLMASFSAQLDDLCCACFLVCLLHLWRNLLAHCGIQVSQVLLIGFNNILWKLVHYLFDEGGIQGLTEHFGLRLVLLFRLVVGQHLLVFSCKHHGERDSLLLFYKWVNLQALDQLWSKVLAQAKFGGEVMNELAVREGFVNEVVSFCMRFGVTLREQD